MNLTQFLDQHRVRYQLPPHRHVRHGWVGVDCPVCSPSTGKFKLGFELATGRAICWTCGSRDRVAIIATLCRVDWATAAELWRTHPKYRPARLTPSRGLLKVPSGVDMLHPAHFNFLEFRGFVPEVVVAEWGVGGIGPGYRLQWRLYIPIHDELGEVVSWTTRAIGSSPQRYISASPEEEAVPHKHILYGAHHTRHAIVVVEGPLDAWAIGPGAVATLGVNYSQQQLAAMAVCPIRVICFDAEPAAQRRAGKLCSDLAAFPGETANVVLETGKDPADADQAELQELRERYLSPLLVTT